MEGIYWQIKRIKVTKESASAKVISWFGLFINKDY